MQQKHYLLIQGRNSHGHSFRPSDWAERIRDLASIFSADRSRPELIYVAVMDGIIGLRVNRELQTQCPEYWNYIVKFVRDHDLQTRDETVSIMTRTEIVAEKARCLYSAWIDKLAAAVSRPLDKNPDTN